MTVRIQPSILSADFVNMQAAVESIATADAVHVDVMDNHFVPNLTFGPEMVKRVQAVSLIPLDVHLMITDVDRWAPDYADLGAFSVTFHAEATSEPVRLARRIRQLGSRVGLAIKPDTDIAPYLELLPEFDQLLVMTVEPGFGGQAFRGELLSKVTAVRAEVESAALDLWVQVDGGITIDTIARASEAGADTFVAGSSVFSAPNAAEAISALRQAAQASHRHGDLTPQ